MNDELQNRLNRISSDIKELKSNQVFGSDSWLVYRTSIDYVQPNASAAYQVDFVPDVDGPFVAKAYKTSQDRTVYGSDYDMRPDPNYQGRWYTTWQIGGGTLPVNNTIFVYSTRKGSIVLTPLTKQTTA